VLEFPVVFKCTEVSKNKQRVDRNTEILLSRFCVDSINKTINFINSEQLECDSAFLSFVIVT
jgi:hypothetical protein